MIRLLPRPGVVNGEHELLVVSDGRGSASVPAMALTVDSPAGFIAALAGAHHIALTAYTLHDGRVLDALAAAARRGATVTVRLERDPLDDAAGSLHRANAAALATLTEAGATAAATVSGEPVLHMKAAVVDGVAWLDDRNWAADGPERILRDSDADDVAAVASAVAGGHGSDGHLATTKAGALRLEADVIDRAGAGPLLIESESFGSGIIYDRLLARAKAGRPTRLIVAGREYGEPADRAERAKVARLTALGVQVRCGDPQTDDLDEKMALVSDDAWAGSANASYARGRFGEQREWGLATRVPAVATELRAAFETNWALAKAVR